MQLGKATPHNRIKAFLNKGRTLTLEVQLAPLYPAPPWVLQVPWAQPTPLVLERRPLLFHQVRPPCLWLHPDPGNLCGPLDRVDRAYQGGLSYQEVLSYIR